MQSDTGHVASLERAARMRNQALQARDDAMARHRAAISRDDASARRAAFGEGPESLRDQEKKGFSSDSDDPDSSQAVGAAYQRAIQYKVKKSKSRRIRMHGKGENKKKQKFFGVHKMNEVGDIVDPKGHPAAESAACLQLGIRTVIGMAESKPNTRADFESFQETVKLQFPQEGTPQTPPHTLADFKFKDYCPQVFKHLRHKFEIDAGDFLVSLCNTLPDGTNALRMMGTPGKSGSLFLFSHDMRFIVKTLPKREARLLREILPNYFQHIMAQPSTLLPHFYGLYRFKPKFGGNVRFVVMNNVFATHKQIHLRYDLKGSTLGRRASAHERAMGSKCVMKDLDMLDTDQKLNLSTPQALALVKQLTADCHLLMSMKIMDYSLLLGIHHPSKHELEAQDAILLPGHTGVGLARQALKKHHHHAVHEVRPYDPQGLQGIGQDGQDCDEVYFIGIIDILMLYTARKKFERVYKTATQGAGASSQPPPQYARRLVRFMESVIQTPDGTFEHVAKTTRRPSIAPLMQMHSAPEDSDHDESEVGSVLSRRPDIPDGRRPDSERRGSGAIVSVPSMGFAEVPMIPPSSQEMQQAAYQHQLHQQPQMHPSQMQRSMQMPQQELMSM